MIPSKTERPETAYDDLDLWSTVAVVGAIVSVQREALNAVAEAASRFAEAIEALATVLQAGGRMAYAGAGSSGMIAQLDRLELPGTFGIGLDRLPLILAGGPESLLALAGEAEDDTATAEASVERCDLGPGDALVAVSASGSTPFTVAALRRARQRGCVTVGLACVPGSPLLIECQYAIAVETPPEIIAGSTRMAAGTAQKCALNILSTGVALRLGHAYRGLMVNMSPDNAKLKQRAVSIVARAAGVDPNQAAAALAEADWSIKTAVTLCAAGVGAAEARVRLERSAGNIREALG